MRYFLKGLTALSFIILVTMSGFGQTVHDIEVGGGPAGPAPYCSPQFITILVGDIVRWTNTGGTHNVDGTLETYPDNPEGFTSGATNNALWVFEHTFTEAGVYGFECAAFDHNETQFGTITVEGVGLGELVSIDAHLFPSPAKDMISIESTELIHDLRVLSLDNKTVIPMQSISAMTYRLDLSALAAGTYFILITTDKGQGVKRFVKQ